MQAAKTEKNCVFSIIDLQKNSLCRVIITIRHKTVLYYKQTGGKTYEISKEIYKFFVKSLAFFSFLWYNMYVKK